MKQEHIKLLLRDLCSRLPYGVVIQTAGVGGSATQGELRCIDNISNNFFVYHDNIGFGYEVGRDDIKPYLFPLSSLTNEQRDALYNIYNSAPEYGYEELMASWFDKHHFDWRGLIEKSLALDATNLNIY